MEVVKGNEKKTEVRKRVSSMHVLLVIDSQNNWYKIFKGAKGPDGIDIQVEQTQWDCMEVSVDHETVHVTAKPSPDPIFGTSQKFERTFVPDFILVRNFVLGIHGVSHLNTLLGLRLGNIPSVNSLDSIFFSTQRAISIAEMKRVQKKLEGTEFAFPVIPIKYYPNTQQHIRNVEYPVVAKVGTSHAGYGKMKFTKSKFNDFATLMAMYNDYVTTEPFVPNVGDIRIQKVGDNIRAFKRIGTNWKGNVGEAEVIDIHPVPEIYQVWAKECCTFFGGLDILSIDAVIDENGKHTILEVNDTATGLNPYHKDEDEQLIKNLVLLKMESEFKTLTTVGT